jgi:NAD(P)-dependent dehydrogenase (short-subunit alcohol dehydrogenase family)
VDLELAGRVVAITGGTSGIGLAAVERFLAEGASVAFCARTAARVTETEMVLRSRYGDAVAALAADVRDAPAMVRFAELIAQRFGRLDTVVHNAGAFRAAPFDELDDAAWTDELELKFFGLIRPTRALLPMLRGSDAASMVYVSSVLARQPQLRLISTAAARAGTLNLAKSLSLELAPGIRFNTLLLGPIDTGQFERQWQARVAAGASGTREAYFAALAAERGLPLGRFGRPAEVAAAIAFLASPLSGFTTGATLEISGGSSRGV